MDTNLLNGLSMDQLNEVKVKYPFYASMVEAEIAKRNESSKLAMQALEVEAKNQELIQAQNAKILKIFAKEFPTKPENLTNILMVWNEVDVLDGEPIEVTVNGKVESRQASHKELHLEVKRNVFWSNTQAESRTTTKTETKRKLAESVFKRNGDRIELVGNFRNGHEACVYLKLDDDGNSANRVLRDSGYIIEPYDGIDFTIKAEK